MDQTVVPQRYCLYARKSSESDEKQALSIDAQIREMLEVAQRENIQVTEIRKESHSAKDSGQRPVYNKLIEDLQNGTFNAILTWAPDRLSRNAGDLGKLVDLMDQKVLIEIKTYNQRFTNSPNEKFLLMILCSQAKLENDNKSLNVKRGLRMKCELGLCPGPAPIGYLNSTNVNEKGVVYLDPDRAPVVKTMFEKIAYDGWSGRKLYNWITYDIKFKTRKDRHTTLSNLYLLLRNPFYYGMLEYPRNSGKWYQGKQNPIITKELFDQVQAKLTVSSERSESKEFAFTKMMRCGLCGSGITAEEKFKRPKNGKVHRYVYYGCTRFNDKYCKCGYIREEELIRQLQEIIDQLSLDEIGMKEQIRDEIARYNHFHTNILGKNYVKPQIKEIDIKNYAKYILQSGRNEERREVLSYLRSSLILKNKCLSIKLNT